MALSIDTIKRYALPWNASRLNNLSDAVRGVAVYNNSINLYQAITTVIDDHVSGLTGTDLTNTPGASTVTIESSTGTDTILPAATTTLAGVLTATDKTRLNNLYTLAGVSGDADLGTFTGTIISNDTTIKTALQELETAIESGSGIPSGNLTSTTNDITVTGGTGALLSAASITFVPGNVNLSELGGTLNLSQIADGGATTGQTLAFNGTNWIASSTPDIDHNDLSNIQGGQATQYYHLNSSLYNVLAASNSSRIIGRYSVGSGAVQALTAPNSVTITAGGAVQLTNDASAPGNSYYYGTDSGGTKGWFTLPTGTGTLSTASDSADIDFTITGDDITAVLTTTGVTPDTYGDVDITLEIEVDDKGRIVSLSELPISILSTAVSDFTEATQDVIGAAITAGSGVSVSYNDGTGLTTISSSTTYTDEQAQDAIGTILLDSSNIDFTYVDATPTISADLTDTAVVAGSYGNSAGSAYPEITVDAKGRLTAASNRTIQIATTAITNFDEAVDDRISALLVAGTDISLSYNDVANTLTINSTAGSGSGPAGANYQLQYYNSAAFGADANINVTPGASPKLVVGTTTAAATLHARAANSLGAATLLAENASGNDIFDVLSNGYIKLGDNESLPRFYQSTTAGGSVSYTGLNFTIESGLDGTSTEGIGLIHTSSGPTSGTLRGTVVRGTFAPTSGTASYTSLYVAPTINQTGGSSGDTFGISIAPTLTSVASAGFKGLFLPYSNASAWGIYQDGTLTPNHFAGGVIINSSGLTAPTYELEVVGTAAAEHFVGLSNAPAVAVGAASVAGTGGNVSLSGTDAGFRVTLNTGTGVSAGGTAFTVTFDTPYSTAPIAVFSSGNTSAANEFDTYRPYCDTTTTELTFIPFAALSSSTTYKWDFIIIGK